MTKREDLVDSTDPPASLNATSVPVMPAAEPAGPAETHQPGVETTAPISVNQHSADVTTAPVAVDCASAANFEAAPSASELPSYYEALKLKKMEIKLDNNEIPSSIPPSYYSSTHPNPNFLDETRIIIDPADVTVFLRHV